MEAEKIYVESGDVFTDIILPILALLIALVTFGFERYKSKQFEKKNNRINWFLTIIIQPQLKEINKIYETLLNKLKSEIKELEEIKSQGNQTELYKAWQAKFKYIKINHRQNFVPLISMIASYDPRLSVMVKNVLREVDDIYSRELARVLVQDENSEKGESIEAQFYANRTKLYRVLYKDLHNN